MTEEQTKLIRAVMMKYRSSTSEEVQGLLRELNSILGDKPKKILKG